jgi:hypothetical protein
MKHKANPMWNEKKKMEVDNEVEATKLQVSTS